LPIAAMAANGQLLREHSYDNLTSIILMRVGLPAFCHF